jgi:glycosyltransferase involved in cell wall biosynthesis
MHQGKRIGVVVPAFNEEQLIVQTIMTIPSLVDTIIVVDDGSKDETVARIKECMTRETDRIVLIRHETNQGVGGAIATGYEWCRDHDVDVAVVMAGDAQMDPDDFPNLIEPVVTGQVDYAKGNRLFTGDAWRRIPHVRYLGNSALSLMTKIASGYWHVADSQCGYTAINNAALKAINWDQMYKRYGQPNDLLVRLNVFSFRVRDVLVRPVYNIGEKSGVKPLRMIPRLSWVLFKLFFWRMKEKYVIRDFHPLLFFYAMGAGLLGVAIPLAGRLIWLWSSTGRIPPVNAMALIFFVLTGMHTLFFAMWLDMDNNRDLK